MNYFDQLADRQLSGAQKAQERRAQKREAKKQAAATYVPSPLERKMQEQNELQKLYREYKRELKTVIAERHGADFKALMKVIWGLEWGNVWKVVSHVANSPWLLNADADTRHATLNYIDHSISRARVRNGMPPFDDGLWDEEPSPEIHLRRMLMGY